MSFDALVADVFRYGCGSSVRSARRSKAYEQTREALQEAGIADADDKALVEVLGMQLADRAFRNMPFAIRQHLSEWTKGKDAQLLLLQIICKSLNSMRWRQTGSRQYDYNSDNRCVLPAAMGSWKRGKAQPNCLGIAQMMVGFAQAVGAEHYMVNVIHANQDTLARYKIRTLELVGRIVAGQVDFAPLAEAIERTRWALLETAALPRQAHHLLVIKLADESWWVVDPYLSALYPLEHCPEWQPATDWVAGHHDRVALVSPPTPIRTYINWINMYMRTLEFVCTIFRGRFGPTPELEDSVLNLIAFISSYLETCTEPTHELKDFALRLAELEIAVDDPDQDTEKLEQLAMLALVSVTYDIENDADLGAIMDESPEQVIERFSVQMNQAAEDRTFERQLAIRLIRRLVKTFLRYLSDLQDDPNTRQHECLEVAWAPMGIGIATLNHVQGTVVASNPNEAVGSSEQPSTLQGKLSALFPGQWVLYDTLALARTRKEPIHLEYLPEIHQTLVRLRTMPDMMIDPLRLLDISESEKNLE